MKKIFVGNLPEHTTETLVTDLFSEFGTVRSVHLVQDVFTRKCKGFGFIEMEGHEARAAIAGLSGKTFEGKQLKVQFEEVRDNKSRGRGKGQRRR